MITIAAALNQARARLHCVGTHADAATDADRLLAHILSQNRGYLYAHGDDPLPRDLLERFQRNVERRRMGIPIAYLLGSCEFYGLQLEVNPAVLVPRPETELLVDAALEKIPADQAWQVADLGTGCGAIALAIAAQRPRCRVLACDRSVAALAVARRNASRLGLHNVEFLAGDWLDPLTQPIPLIVSNPPYVNAADHRLQDDGLRHEPLAALTPGGDGLEAIRRIIKQTSKQLFNNGWLMLEHGYDQGAQVRSLMNQQGYTAVETRRDLSGIERLTLGCRKS